MTEVDRPEPVHEMLLNIAMWHTTGPKDMPARFHRAIELAAELDDTRAELTALWGLWTATSMSGDPPRALEVAERYGAGMPPSGSRGSHCRTGRLMFDQVCDAPMTFGWPVRCKCPFAPIYDT